MIVVVFLWLPDVVFEHGEIEGMGLDRTFVVLLRFGDQLKGSINRNMIWGGVDDQ